MSEPSELPGKDARTKFALKACALPPLRCWGPILVTVRHYFQVRPLGGFVTLRDCFADGCP